MFTVTRAGVVARPFKMCMWYFRLITEKNDIFYYDSDELNEARKDRIIYGGYIEDRNGKIY